MKITAGLGSIDEYIPFVKAGADEVFCGYVPYSWTEKYGALNPLNRREVLYYNVQLGAYEELCILKKMQEKYPAKIHLTFNSLYYTKEQYPAVAKILWECVKLGLDSFIIADLGLLLYLKKEKIPCKIHLSGECAEVNRGLIDTAKELGASRVIFHRKNTMEDMRSCISHARKQGSKMEFEAFILNEMCHFTGAFCNSLHCDELPHLCRVPYWLGKRTKEKGRFDSLYFSIKKMEQAEEMEAMEDAEEKGETKASIPWDEEGYLTGESGCGLCALYRLREAGVTHLKLVGRGNYTDFMKKDIQALRRALDILQQEKTEAAFRKRMKEAVFPRGCSGNCYYREPDFE